MPTGRQVSIAVKNLLCYNWGKRRKSLIREEGCNAIF